MLQAGDDQSFVAYEEKMIYSMQRYFSAQTGMEGTPVIAVCAQVEDELHQEALKAFNLPPTAAVWASLDCINYFQSKCESLLRQLEGKKFTNWKKVFDDHSKNPSQIIKIIYQEEVESKAKPKAKSSSARTSNAAVTGAAAAPAAPKAPPKPKAPKPKKAPSGGKKAKGADATAPPLPGGDAELPFPTDLGGDPLDDDWGFNFNDDALDIQVDASAWEA